MNSAVRNWVTEIEALTTPSAVVYCDGSKAERDRLIAECLATGELIELNQQKLPGCYLHRSAPHDVARTEHLTFVSTTDKDDAGPTNNWMAPDAAREKLTPLFRGSMKGRTMFVVPFLMGPPGSPYSKVGVEITDSRYVVLNMRIMTRVGPGRARSPGRLRRLHALPALAGRSQPRPPLHRALSRRERGVVDRIRLRRQRAARQEVPGAASRELSARTAKAGSPSTCSSSGASTRTGPCGTSRARFLRRAARPTWRCSCRRRRCRAGRRGPSATTSPGFVRAPTAGCGPSIPKRDFSACSPARATARTRRRST